MRQCSLIDHAMQNVMAYIYNTILPTFLDLVINVICEDQVPLVSRHKECIEGGRVAHIG